MVEPILLRDGDQGISPHTLALSETPSVLNLFFINLGKLDHLLISVFFETKNWRLNNHQVFLINAPIFIQDKFQLAIHHKGSSDQ